VTDVERRPTGEHPVVKNGHVTWRWLVGTIISVGLIVGAGVVTIKTDVAGMKVDIQYIKNQMVLERGMAERHDREIRSNRETIIELRSKAHRHGR
jgi:hypothetical protein